MIELPVDTWPMVKVGWTEETGVPFEEMVHRDNLRNQPNNTKSKKKEGDGANQAELPVKIKPAFRPHQPLVPGDWDEPMLF